MRELYSDDYASVAVGTTDRLIPESLRRLSGAAVFLALVATMALWSYRLGTRDAGEVPVIKAIDGPSRIQPEDPGGLQAAHQGLEVNRVLAGNSSSSGENVRPPKPAPAPLPALATEDAPQGELVQKAPAAMAERVLGDDLPMPDDDAGAAAVAALTATPIGADTPSTLGEADAIDEDAIDKDAAAEPRPRNRPSNLSFARARAPAPIASERPAVKPAASPRHPVVAAVASAAPVAATPASATSSAGREVSRPSSGARLVQLGAFDNEAMTRKAWSELVARNGDLLGSKSLFVERTTANARVFYRLRVAGFTSADQTRQMCEQLRARGVACIPVTLD